jgi:hypothetical protein
MNDAAVTAKTFRRQAVDSVFSVLAVTTFLSGSLAEADGAAFVPTLSRG